MSEASVVNASIPDANASIPQGVSIQTAPKNLWEKAVCLSVTIGRFGVKRKTDAKIDTDAERRLLSVQKTILECEQLKAIEKLDGEIRNHLRKYCLPHIFKDGVYLVPIPMIGSMYDYMEQKGEERKAAVEEFLKVYPDKAAEHKARLGEQYKRTDYPDVDSMRDQFKFSYQFIEFGTPGALTEIRKDIYEKERDKAVKSWAETTDVVKDALRKSFNDLITHMVDKLDTSEDGKRRVFRNSMVENMNEFFEVFKTKNICEDNQLEALIEQAKEVMQGVTPDTLRTDDELRVQVRNKMAEIKSKVDTELVVQQGRRYLFDEEEATPAEPSEAVA